MGVATNRPHQLYDIAFRAPLLKFLELTPVYSSMFSSRYEVTTVYPRINTLWVYLFVRFLHGGLFGGEGFKTLWYW